MRFKINIHYYTGDSFKTESREQFLDGYWENEDALMANIEAIEAHWQCYCMATGRYIDLPVITEAFSDITGQWWYTDEKTWKNSIKLQLDDGSIYQTNVFWTGYFEGLKDIEVVLDYIPERFKKYMRKDKDAVPSEWS